MKQTMRRFNHLRSDIEPLEQNVEPVPEQVQYIEVPVNGRKEHETVIRSADKCREFGLDQAFETIRYLNRWGGWLDDGKNMG